MLLIGMFDSPYVRRVAVSLKRLEVPFEHANWSVGSDFERIRESSPLGRVPVLVLDDGTTLVDSATILARSMTRSGLRAHGDAQATLACCKMPSSVVA